MSFKDMLKKGGLITEETPEAPAAVPPPAPARPVVTDASPTGSITLASAVSAVYNDGGQLDQAYAKVLAKTDLNDFPDYKTFKDEAKLLETALPGPGNDGTRFNAALTTLTGHNLLTKDRLLSVFSGAMDKIAEVENKLKQAIEAKRASQVQAKQDEIERIKTEIDDRQKKMQTLIAEVGQAQIEIQQTEANFAAAIARRRSEIQTEQSVFSATLK